METPRETMLANTYGGATISRLCTLPKLNVATSVGTNEVTAAADVFMMTTAASNQTL